MLRGVISLFLLLVAACDDRVCGMGTVRYGDECVLVDPFDKEPPVITVDPPRYTRQVGIVRLTSNKPAKIYYTIDGQSPTTDSAHEDEQVVIPGVPDNAELRFFAIDLNGNRSPEQLITWIIDRDGPGAPLDFALSFNSPTRTVQFTPPPDPRPGGVVVARVEGPLASPPISGKAYDVGDVLSPGVTIVAKYGPEVTTLTQFAESLAASPGLVRYAAWAFDDLLNYGPPAGDYALVPIPTQMATIHVDAAAGTVNVTSPASHTMISGTTSFSATTGLLTVDLTMRNDTTRVLYGPKMVLTNTLPLPNGVASFNDDTTTDGTATGQPVRFFGGAILPGTTQAAAWKFKGANATTTMDLTLEIKNGPVLTAPVWDYSSVTGGSIMDAEYPTVRKTVYTGPGSTGPETITGEMSEIGAAPTGQGGGSMTTQGGFTPDGRLILGNRTSGTISSFDVQTGARLITTELRPQKAFVPRVVLDRSGSAVYALVADGHPYNIYQNGGGSTRSELVRLDATTLTVTGRLDIGNTRTRNIDISPDSRWLIVSTGITSLGVLVIDLSTFTIKTTIKPDFKPQAALFAPAIEGQPSVVVVGESAAIYRLDGTLVRQDPVAGVTGKVVGAALGPNNKLWVAREDELVTNDLGTGVSTIIPVLTGWSVAIYGNEIYAYGSYEYPPPNPPPPPAPQIQMGQNIKRIDDTGAVLKSYFGWYSLDSHWVGRSPF